MDKKMLEDLIDSSPILKGMYKKFKEHEKEERGLKEKVTGKLQLTVGRILKEDMKSKDSDSIISMLSEFAYEITLEVTRNRLELEKLRTDHEKLRTAYTIMVDSKLDND